jgi:3-hydroxyacyl-CoA dehydrogenase
VIEKVGVLGAGSMGAAVAALAASAGLEVILLDVKGEDDPAGPARRGLERAVKQRAFLDPSAAGRVRVGNVEDDLPLLAGCDWVLEAIIEEREAKRTLFQRLAAILPPRRSSRPTPRPSRCTRYYRTNSAPGEIGSSSPISSIHRVHCSSAR